MDIEKKIKEEVKKDLSENKLQDEISREVQRDVQEVLKSEVKDRVREELVRKHHLPLGRENIGRSGFRAFSDYFVECWRGGCKRVGIVMIISYLLIALVMASCLLFPLPFYIDSTLLGGFSLILAIALSSLFVSAIFAMFSENFTTSLAFALVLSLPAAIIILLGTIRFAGLILIALILLTFIIRRR